MITLKDGRTVHLGRQRLVHAIMGENTFTTVLADGRVKQALRFGPYYDKSKDVTPPPPSSGPTGGWRVKGAPSLAQMLMNDQWGDCVIASKGHMLGCTSGNETSPILMTDAECRTNYNICGVNQDNGCVITDVLDYWKANGLVASGKTYTIKGYVAVDWTNKNLVQVLLDVFGPGMCIGINLPNDWTCTNCVWNTPTQGIVGGHDVAIIDYDETYVYISTWGGVVQMPWDVFTAPGGKYIEECYLVLVPQWYANANLAPNGIDGATLEADLAALPNTVPPLPGPVVPPIVPPIVPPVVPPSPTTSQLVLAADTPAGTYSIGLPGGKFLQPSTVAAVLSDLTGSAPSVGATFTIPPGLLSLLHLVCSLAPAIPPPWGAIFTVVCGLLPANLADLIMDDKNASIPFTGDLVAKIKAAELVIPNITHPLVRRAAKQLVELVKGKSDVPCGCK